MTKIPEAAEAVTIPPIPHGSTVEKIIVGKLVEGFLAAGYSLSVYDGEEVTVERSSNPVVIFEEIDGEWSVDQVFEAESYAEAEFMAFDCCTEPYAPGVTAMHFIIGEVA